MDTHPQKPTPRDRTPQVPVLRPTGTDDTADRVPGAAATPVQQPLPFDDGADEPVAFSLTARAKREIAPEDLPPLRVVRDRRRPIPGIGTDHVAGVTGAAPVRPDPPCDGDGAWPVRDDPFDTRPSRARALSRAGLSATEIAGQLRVEPLLVRAWTGSTHDPAVGTTTDAPARRTGRPHRSVGAHGVDRPMWEAQAADASDDPDDEQPSTAFGLARAAATEQARRTLRHDPAFAAGLGLLAAIVEVDRNALTVTTGDEQVARAIVTWLDSYLPIDPARMRVVLRIGPRAAADLVAHRWAGELGLERHAVAVARWHDAPEGHAVQAIVRVADPGVAASVAGWRDALLAPTGPDPADVAF